MSLAAKPGRLKGRSSVVVALVVVASFILAVATLSMPGIVEATRYYGGGHTISEYSEFVEKVLKPGVPAAVMFKTPWCPTCNRVYPHWALLEEKSPVRGVYFYNVIFTSGTEDLFKEYNVSEVPTYILFVDGRPVKRLVGEPGSENLTQAFLEWAIEGYEIRGDVVEKSPRGIFLASAPIAAFLAGIGVAFSPCSFPLLVARIASANSGRLRALDAVKCGIASSLSAISIGAVFTATGALIGSAQGAFVAVAGGVTLSMGLAGYARIDPYPLFKASLRGDLFCLLYGIAALQCSLPLFAASMALVYSSGSLGAGLGSLLGFSAGLMIPLTCSLYMAARSRRLADRLVLVASKGVLERISNAVIAAAGLAILASSFGVI